MCFICLFRFSLRVVRFIHFVFAASVLASWILESVFTCLTFLVDFGCVEEEQVWFRAVDCLFSVLGVALMRDRKPKRMEREGSQQPATKRLRQDEPQSSSSASSSSSSTSKQLPFHGNLISRCLAQVNSFQHLWWKRLFITWFLTSPWICAKLLWLTNSFAHF